MKRKTGKIISAGLTSLATLAFGTGVICVCKFSEVYAQYAQVRRVQCVANPDSCDTVGKQSYTASAMVSQCCYYQTLTPDLRLVTECGYTNSQDCLGG